MDKTDQLLLTLETLAQANDDPELKETLLALSKQYRKSEKRMEKIITLSDKQHLQLHKLNKKLDQYKNHLEERVAQEVEKNREKEKMLVERSKLAAMGEMVDAIAHQWKQPLSVIDLYIQTLSMDFAYGEVDEAYVREFQQKGRRQIRHLLETLHEFRNFLRPGEKWARFPLARVVESTLVLMKDDLHNHDVRTRLTGDETALVEGNENELKHVVLNLISNAKDVFRERNVREPSLHFRLFREEERLFLEVEDNGGGVPQEVIEHIFKPHVTTKEEGGGTGIGLYMSALITGKHGGELSVTNRNEGACFTLVLPLARDSKAL